jgi:hypothetical protein
MARAVGTRNYRQCKIYHMKMVKNFQDIEYIIEGLYEREEGLKEKIQQLNQNEPVQQLQECGKINKMDDRPTDLEYMREEVLPLNALNLNPSELGSVQ